MEWNKEVPEMSAGFCDRVIAESRNIEQRRPMNLRTLWAKATAVLSINPSWTIATMALVFVVGMAIGMETYSIVDVADVMQI